MRKSVPMVHVSPWEPDWPTASCSQAAGTKISVGQRYHGTWWSKHSTESTVEGHLDRACKARLCLPRQTNLPHPCGFTPALSAAGDNGERGKKPPMPGLPTVSATAKGDQLGLSLSLQNSSLLAKSAPLVPPSPHPAFSEDTHLLLVIPTY